MAKPLIYQMLPRLWGNMEGRNICGGTLSENGCGTFGNIDDQTLDYLGDMGFSHVWYTGVVRHATTENTHGCTPSSPAWVKGKAGSPYSITDWFDVNPYLASDPSKRMAEFQELVSRTHRHGLKVIIDFVPNHVARDYGAFSRKPIKDGRDADGHPVFGALDDESSHWKAENDFFYYPGQKLVLPVKNQHGYVEMPAKASGNAYSPTPGINDWYDTIKLNYCDFHTPTWDKMYEVVDFWVSLGVDGFRCDMVELVPPGFFTWLIAKTKRTSPNVIFIAEVYQKNLYRKYIYDVGFDYLYDKSGLYDSLREIVRKNVVDHGMPPEQWQSAERITWNWQELGDIQPRMLNFLENHDEQRFASDFFGLDPDNSYAALYASLTFNTCPFMLYFGEEIGERGMDKEGMSGLDGRTSIFDWWKVDSLSRLFMYIHGRTYALTDKEKSTLEKYKEALNLASRDRAVSEGSTYDLCYYNYSSDGFDKKRHFAFLRDFEEETLLIICNFASHDSTIDLLIPRHAFDWLGMSETSELSPDKPIRVEVPAFGAKVIKICG